LYCIATSTVVPSLTPEKNSGWGKSASRFLLRYSMKERMPPS